MLTQASATIYFASPYVAAQEIVCQCKKKEHELSEDNGAHLMGACF